MGVSLGQVLAELVEHFSQPILDGAQRFAGLPRHLFSLLALHPALPDALPFRRKTRHRLLDALDGLLIGRLGRESATSSSGRRFMGSGKRLRSMARCAATTASHLQKGQRSSHFFRLANTRRKIAWQASSHSSRRAGPRTRWTMPRTSGANLRASALPASRSPARKRWTFSAQLSGGQSHGNISGLVGGGEVHIRRRQ